MGKTSRKKYTPEFKAQVSIEALKERSTLAELAKKYEVSPTMISHWKAYLVKNAGAATREPGTRSRLGSMRRPHRKGKYGNIKKNHYLRSTVQDAELHLSGGLCSEERLT